MPVSPVPEYVIRIPAVTIETIDVVVLIMALGLVRESVQTYKQTGQHRFLAIAAATVPAGLWTLTVSYQAHGADPVLPLILLAIVGFALDPDTMWTESNDAD
jgi:hypothetical protein